MAPRSHTARLVRVLLAVLYIAASGCAGDDDGAASDDEQIRAAVKRLMESKSVEDQCVAGVTDRFVRDAYGTLARCRAVNTDDENSEPDTATTSATRVDGDRATTVVTLTSVKGSRATGRVALVRQEGAWTVDRLGVDFLRSIFATLHHEAENAEQRAVIGCFAEAARAMSDADVRRFGNLFIGQRLDDESMPPSVQRCIKRSQSKATTA